MSGSGSSGSSTPAPSVAGDTGPAAWRGPARIAGRWAVRVAVAVSGAMLGVLLLGGISAPIGPFDAVVSFVPAGGGAQVDVPPLGALNVDVYDGPLRLDIQLQRVDQDRARALATDPVRLAGVVDQVSADLRGAVVRLVWSTAAAAFAGAALTSLLLLRRRREMLIAAALTGGLLAGTAGVGAVTWRPEALSQPTYTGLLVNATSLIGSAEDIAARFDAYRASLEDLVANVGSLYSALSTLPDPGPEETVALLHVSDLHLNPAGFDLVRQVVDQFPIDAVLDTGDITDWGSTPENQLISSVGSLPVPYVYIRGNHDSGTTAALIDAQSNTTVLDGTAVTVAGIEVVGTPDPRFTPDKSAGAGSDGDASSLEATGEDLAAFAESLPEPPAIAMVHDPLQAPPLDGVVPLVLAGHTHQREVSQLDAGTRLMVEGSTGGAGLRALEGEYPEPLACTVLYLDPDTGDLRAYDEITLGGLGSTEVTIERTVVPRTEEDADPPANGDAGTDAGSPTSPPG